MSTHHDKIKVNKPEPFDGERITFVLSYLTTGHALMWKHHFVKIDMNKVVKFDAFTTLLKTPMLMLKLHSNFAN